MASTGKRDGKSLPSTSTATTASGTPKQDQATKSFPIHAHNDSDTNSHSRLLSLPAELRNAIYELVIADAPPHYVYIRPLAHLPSAPADATQPALTRTCRQLRHETLPIHYAFEFRCFDRSPDITATSLGLWTSQLHLIDVVYIYACPHLEYYRLELGTKDRYKLEIVHTPDVSKMQAREVSSLLRHREEHLAIDKGFLDVRAAAGTFRGRLTVAVLAQLVDTVHCEDLQLVCAVCELQQS